MSQTQPNLFLSIGKPVKDEYGRSIGRVISFATTPTGKFDSVFIEYNSGKFAKQSMDSVIFSGADITLISKIKSQAAIFYDQIPFIWRKDQALKDLVDKKKVSSELYRELHSNFDTVLSQLKKDAQVLLDDIDQGITNCEEELKAMSYGVLHLELEHEIGKISDDHYKSAISSLQENIKRTNAEKNDLEATKSKLSSMLIGDSPQDPEPKNKMVEVTVSENADLPEPPVVVYVKEVGKAGI